MLAPEIFVGFSICLSSEFSVSMLLDMEVFPFGGTVFMSLSCCMKNVW